MTLGIGVLHASADDSALIELGGRHFDVRYPADKIRKDDTFIPLTRIPWIDAAFEKHSLLESIVLHVRDRSTSVGTPIAQQDLFGSDRFFEAPLPDGYEADGHVAFWRSRSDSGDSGTITYFPDTELKNYAVNCGYVASRGRPLFCGLSFVYKREPHIQVVVRIYRPGNLFNHFGEIFRMTYEVVRCLDVTAEVSRGSWKPSPIIDPKEAAIDDLLCDENSTS